MLYIHLFPCKDFMVPLLLWLVVTICLQSSLTWNGSSNGFTAFSKCLYRSSTCRSVKVCGIVLYTENMFCLNTCFQKTDFSLLTCCYNLNSLAWSSSKITPGSDLCNIQQPSIILIFVKSRPVALLRKQLYLDYQTQCLIW